MEFYSKTDVGKVRKTNQDAVISKSIDDDFVWSVVCDGMGGTNGGGIASSMAVDNITNYLKKHMYAEDRSEKLQEIMSEAIQSANKAIFEKSKKDMMLSGMGTTVVLAMVDNNNLHVMYAGDSRAYIIRNSNIKQLSKDHSMVQAMVDSGEITLNDAKNHPQKNIITRALGIMQNVELDYIHTEVKSKDIILLCTDGLTNHVDDKKIHEICAINEFSEVAEKLTKEANKMGGKDNITVSIIKV